jgi:hypothetical protein
VPERPVALRHKLQIKDTKKAETMSTQSWSQPQRYEIRFEGHLSAYRAQMFEGLEMVLEPDGETVLTGPVIDQAALHGILNRIRDLGVPLLSVKRLSQDEAKTERGVRNATHN